MWFWFVYNKGLDKGVLNSIRNREYSQKQLVAMFQELNNKKNKRNKGVMVAMVAFALCATFVLMTSMMNPANTAGIIPTVIAILVVFVIAFCFIKVNMVNKAKNQFMNALKKGYPELVGQFESLIK
ncbi:MAG: hypothetical protein RR678_11225 [Lachnospiraceae bacterium]